MRIFIFYSKKRGFTLTPMLSDWTFGSTRLEKSIYRETLFRYQLHIYFLHPEIHF